MRIGHYAPHLWASGGIATYVQRLGAAQTCRGDTVEYLSMQATDADVLPSTHIVADEKEMFQKATTLNLDVLHLHGPVSTPPPARLPTVRTMHDHQGTCPSGSRYLPRTGRPCDRIPTLGGCLFGHLVDRCGSARPQRIANNFSRFRQEVERSAQIPTITVSDFVRDRMIEAGSPPEQLTTILSPAPIVSAPPPLDDSLPPRFLFLGRLIAEKGILWLLRAFVRACETPSFEGRLDVAGTGDLDPEARRFVDRHGIADRVTFHGWVPPDNVSALLKTAWAVVFPSLWHEPAGLVSLEAAAHGRALIASHVGGIPEYATDDYALLVRPNNIEDLATALKTLAADRSRTAALGRRAQTVATDHFSMSNFLNRLDTLYETVAPADADSSR